MLLGEFLGAQEAGFGSNLSNAEIIQLLRQGAGEVYFAYHQLTRAKVGYAIIQTKELEEGSIQTELRSRSAC